MKDQRTMLILHIVYHVLMQLKLLLAVNAEMCSKKSKARVRKGVELKQKYA